MRRLSPVDADHDNRFAHDTSLLFHGGDTLHRHAVNIGVSARVDSNEKAFAKLRDFVHGADFKPMLEAAKRNPKGKEAQQFMETVIKFCNLSASKVPWGPRERAAEMTFLMAMHRANGAGNVFYSAAPDDVHSILGIRYSHPFAGPDAFPAVTPEPFLEALRAQRDSERVVGGFDMREDALQTLAAKNPIATTLAFSHIVQNLGNNLIGLSSSRVKNEPIDGEKRRKGVYGLNLMNRHVIETNKRTALHIHGQGQGGLSPVLLADVAGEPELRKMAMDALDTQICGELPLEYHAVYELQKLLHVAARRDAAYEPPEPIAKEAYTGTDEEYVAYLRDSYWPDFLHHARMTVMNRHTHEHMQTCVHETKPGKKPNEGCRLAFIAPHDIDQTRCVELRPLKSGDVPNDQHGLRCRCRLCYADGALSDESLSTKERQEALVDADNKHELFHTAHEPTRLSADATKDHRSLAVDVRRRVMPARRVDGDPPDVHDDTINDDGSVNEHAKLLQESVNARQALDFPEGAEGDKQARLCLERLIAPGQKLHWLLDRPELRAASERIEALCAEPRDCYAIEEDVDKIQAAERKRADELRRLLGKWVCPEMACYNARIADYCTVVSGCLGSNSVPYSLGAGTGSKGASMYQIKCVLPLDPR